MKITKLLIPALAFPAVMLTAPVHAAGDAARGKTLYSRCAICHSLEPGKNMLGPPLVGIMGRKAATQSGFSYSPALKKYAKTWDASTMDAYITAPMKAVPGTRMVFAGMPNAKDRADLIAYLQSVTK